MKLVDEGDDLSVGASDLSEDGLEAFLELSAILGACDHRGHVKGDEALVPQGLGDVTGDDALGEPFNDGGLTDARFTDENRVILRASRQDLNDAPDLVVAPDDGIELAFARNLGEIATVLRQGLEGSLGVGRGDRVGA